MKMRFLALFTAILLTMAGCDGGDAGETAPPVTGTGAEVQTDNTEENLGMNVLKDADFANGFMLRGMDSAVDGSTVYKTIRLGSEPPAWGIAQWWSAYNLKDGEETSTDTLYRLADGHKSVTLDRTTGAVTLALDSSHDFAESSAKAPAKWPHLLLEQSIDSKNTALKGAESVTAKLDFTIDRCEDLRTARRGLHSQFAWFIYIVDVNPDSPGKGNFLWFGLNLFCPPNAETNPYSSQDTAGGPGNFIYSLASRDIFAGTAEAGSTIRFELDILPHVKEALEVAQSRGFMIGTTWEDCAITGTNIGWEIFDRWDVAITINDIGIYRK